MANMLCSSGVLGLVCGSKIALKQCPVGYPVGACPGRMRPHSMALPAALEAETKIFIFGGLPRKEKHNIT